MAVLVVLNLLSAVYYAAGTDCFVPVLNLAGAIGLSLCLLKPEL